MRTINATLARNSIYELIDKTNENSEPIIITGKRGNAVLVSEDDWRAIQETLFLVSIPNLRESIIAGMKEPISKCSNKIVW
jgi:prevent-host-death family protein